MKKLQEDVARMKEQLRAKECILEEALSRLANVPPHSDNFSVVANVLGVELNLPIEPRERCFDYRVSFEYLFSDHLCVGIELKNFTSQPGIVSCVFLCLQVENSIYDTTSVIFDGLNAVESIPSGEERHVVAVCSRAVLMDGRALLAVDCRQCPAGGSLHPCLLRALSTADSRRSSFSHFSIPVGADVKPLVPTTILDVPISEGETLFRCLTATHSSRRVTHSCESVTRALRTLGGFTPVDFGEWQLMVGAAASLYDGITVFCVSCGLKTLPFKCKIFSRKANELRSFERRLQVTLDGG